MTKMRKGQSRSFNNWLRVRILAQGLTVAAVVAGSWAYGSARPMAHELDASAAREKAAEERVAFEDRLRLAEEVTRAESASASSPTNVQATAVTTTKEPTSTPTTSSSWWSWWGWNESKRGKDKS
jgi:Hypoxia induced protein conserved region